jgi:hypothetical protein
MTPGVKKGVLLKAQLATAPQQAVSKLNIVVRTLRAFPLQK